MDLRIGQFRSSDSGGPGNCSSRLTLSLDDLHYLEFRLRGADLQLRGGVPITSQPAQIRDCAQNLRMPFPGPLLAKPVAVPPHALRQGETHVVLIALECFFVRCKTRYQRASPRSLWERFYLPFEKSQGRRHSLRR